VSATDDLATPARRRRPRNPLDRLRSLKLRLGLLIVLAIGVTLVTMLGAGALDIRLRWAVVLSVVLSLGTVQVVARGTVAPVRRLHRAATRIAAGEHGVRVPVTGWDEVAELSGAFNRMAAELEETDRIRRDLVADAAHELRTPVAALRAVLENAVDGIAPADPADLLEQVQRLGTLADQLLDLSRLEGGAATLDRRAADVRALVAEATASHASAAARGVAPPAVDVPAGLTATVDPARVRQVVLNLLENAGRHAPGAPVPVRARGIPPGGVRLTVEDRGPGLPPGDEVRVFDRFARADRSRTVPGSGLGLAIVRSIAELHGGSARAETVAPHGCRIVVDLP
jgi:signal transduction histidine kinase